MKALLDDGYVIGGCKCGTHWNPRVAAQARDVLVCRNATTHAITKIVGVFVLCDSHTKSVAVELTDGDGGVYARGGRSQLLASKVQPDFVFAELNANGDGVIYRCDSSNKGGASAATLASYDGGGYGICGVTLAKVPNHTTPTLVWANASGGNVLINGRFAEVAVNLGGNTLDVDLCGKRIYMTNVRVPDDGNINVHGGGILEVRNDSSGCGFVASNVNLYADCELRAFGQVHVHDYVAAATSNAVNLATGTLNVYGSFKPVTRYFRGCTMRDGSTLDFSEWPGEWPVTTAYTCDGNKAISFAAGATVKVKVGGKKISTKTPIIRWTTEPNATFVCGDENRHFTIKKKNDGLYLYTGTFIIVR